MVDWSKPIQFGVAKHKIVCVYHDMHGALVRWNNANGKLVSKHFSLDGFYYGARSPCDYDIINVPEAPLHRKHDVW